MANEIKSTRISAGNYRVTRKDAPAATNRAVNVVHVEYHDGPWWVAGAEWDHSIMSDPHYTKREAMESARIFLYADWA